MPKFTDEAGNMFPVSADLLQSIHTIHQFINLFPHDKMDDDIRQIAINMILSKDESEWTALDHRYIYFIQQQLSALSKAMLVIDRELNPKLRA